MIFVENSGNSIKSYVPEKYYDRYIETVFNSPVEDVDRGKGYKEIELIEAASRTLNSISGSKVIIKVTGRLQFLNIKTFMGGLIKLNAEKNTNWIICSVLDTNKMKLDSRAFICNVNFLVELTKNKVFVNTKVSLESVLWLTVEDLYKNGNIHLIKPKRPFVLKGISGGFGGQYRTGLLWFLYKYARLKLTRYERLFNYVV